MLRVSSLSGIRPIIRRAIRIAPQPSLLSQFYLHSDSADLLPQIASSSFRSAPLKNASRFFAVGHSPYQKRIIKNPACKQSDFCRFIFGTAHYCTYSLLTYPIWPLYLILLQSPSVPTSSAESPPERTPRRSAVSLADARTLILVVAVTVPMVSAPDALSASCRNSVLI